MNRICPCCEEYGDVWEVSFTNLNGRRGVMCFECDTVWDSLCDDQVPSYTNFESLMKENGIIPDWSSYASTSSTLTGRSLPHTRFGGWALRMSPGTEVNAR